jgi:rRNA maturation endonuclease Nob1
MTIPPSPKIECFACDHIYPTNRYGDRCPECGFLNRSDA